MTTSFFKLKNSVFSLFVMTCPPTPHRGHIEEFWIGISKAQNVKNYRFEAPKPPKMVLTSPKWPRNIQVTILNPYGNFIFEIQKSKIPVRYRGLSPLPWTPPYVTFFAGAPPPDPRNSFFPIDCTILGARMYFYTLCRIIIHHKDT